jgi:branched-chain amino acid transport system permease protein
VLFDGFAYGMLLFLLSVGLSVTLGMMNFVNLAHCSFAMVGGYATVSLMTRFGWPVPRDACPWRSRSPRLVSVVPRANAVSAALPLLRPRPVPADHRHRLHLGRGLRLVLHHRAAVDPRARLAAGLAAPRRHELRELPHVPDRGRPRGHVSSGVVPGKNQIRARIRAAVDNQRMARGLGIDVDRAFMLTFALGGGLAGLGGALSIQVVGLDPTFALAYLVYVLIVVAVGGLGSIGGSFAAAVVLGISDMAGKYYFPWLGAFLIYLVMVGLLMWRPQGLFGKR